MSRELLAEEAIDLGPVIDDVGIHNCIPVQHSMPHKIGNKLQYDRQTDLTRFAGAYE